LNNEKKNCIDFFFKKKRSTKAMSSSLCDEKNKNEVTASPSNRKVSKKIGIADSKNPVPQRKSDKKKIQYPPIDIFNSASSPRNWLVYCPEREERYHFYHKVESNLYLKNQVTVQSVSVLSLPHFKLWVCSRCRSKQEFDQKKTTKLLVCNDCGHLHYSNRIHVITSKNCLLIQKRCVGEDYTLSEMKRNNHKRIKKSSLKVYVFTDNSLQHMQQKTDK
jgi:hypothetical protein